MTSKDNQFIERIPFYIYLCNMRNPFYNDIYEILRAKGSEGLPVGVVAKHVYNRHAGLFNPELTYERVYQTVRYFLWAESIKPSSPFTATGRGKYALKPNLYRQMQMDFKESHGQETGLPEERQKEGQPSDHPSLF